ncbi:MAG: FtsQ-type POTRA domain-containing protein [Oxalobacter sp.]|jgi:cell division protein FtsQ|nr:MAG: FtsQ-type POTRA domain-containing protein [Oxalobacter sp.]
MWHDIRTLNIVSGILWALCGVALLAGTLVWLAQRPMFALRGVVVQGLGGAELRHVNVLTVRSTALPRIKGNFFTANLDAVRTAFETVPWVRKASVRRDWPDQLVVSIEEHQALGTWGEEGQLLSTKGDVFVANLAEAEENNKLLEFFGPDGSEKEVLVRYAELEEWLKPIGLTPVAMTLSERYAWTITLDNGVKLKLGRDRNKETVKTQVVRMTQIYPLMKAYFGERIDSLDLRYPNGLAVSAGGV